MLARSLNIRSKITLTILLLSAYSMPVNAHPAGNFSVNNYSRINAEKTQIYLRCVADMAEISAVKESQQIDAGKNNVFSNEEPSANLEKLIARYAANLKLFVDNQRIKIQSAAKNTSLIYSRGKLAGLISVPILFPCFLLGLKQTVEANNSAFVSAIVKERKSLWSLILSSKKHYC